MPKLPRSPLHQYKNSQEALIGRRWIRDIRGGCTMPVIHEFMRIMGSLSSSAAHRGQWYLHLEMESSWSILGSEHICCIFPWTNIPGRGKGTLENESATKMQVFLLVCPLPKVLDGGKKEKSWIAGPWYLCAMWSIQRDNWPLPHECWFRMLCPGDLQHLALTAKDMLDEWWLWTRKEVPKALRKGLGSVVILVAWQI